jgi:uncharacterized protein
MKIDYFLIFFLILLSSSNSFAASFDCDEAREYIEFTICENEELNDIDSLLGLIYFSIINQSSEEERFQLIKEQRQWLVHRNNECKETDSICLKSLYKKRINELKSNYRSRNISQKLDEDVFCSTIKRDLESAIVSCGFDQRAIPEELSKGISGLVKYSTTNIAINKYGYTQIFASKALTSAKGTTLLLVERFQGDKCQRLIEGHLVDNNTLSEVLKLPFNQDKKSRYYKKNFREINARPFRRMLNKGKKISNYLVYLYYIHGVGDVIVVPDCYIRTHYGGRGECSELNSVSIYIINNSNSVEQLCKIEHFDIYSIWERLENRFLHSTSAKKRAEALQKINLQPDLYPIHYNTIGLEDDNEIVRRIALHSLGCQSNMIPLLLQVAAKDSSKDLRESASDTLSSCYTSNGAGISCEDVHLLEQNLDLIFEALNKSGTSALFGLLGLKYNSSTKIVCCMNKSNTKKIINYLERLKNPTKGVTEVIDNNRRCL